MFEEIPVFDEGQESEPTVEGAAEAALEADSAEETKETAQIVDDKGTESEGEKVSETEAKEEDEPDDSDKSLDEVIADVDKEIANEKNSKYFRDSLRAYKKAFLRETDKVRADFEPLKDFGEVQKIQENLEIFKGLDSFETDPATNLPTVTVKPFVDKFVEKKGIDKAVAVMMEFGNLESPYTKGYNLFHEVIAGAGLDPTRIEDYKKFQANGYKLANEGFAPPDAEELQSIPENFREAFISLSPDERDEILLMSDAVRDKALKGIQTELDSQRKEKENEVSEAQAEVEAEQRRKQEFFTAVNTKEAELIDVSGTKLFDSFAESLVNTGLDELDSLSIANLMSMTLNSTGVEAKRNIALLEKNGIKIDESLMTTFNEWLSAARHMATFEVEKNETSFKTAKEQFESLEAKLIRKADPIVAAIAKHKLSNQKARAESKSDLLTNLTQQNGLNPNDGNAHPITNTTTVSADWESVAPF